MQSTIARWESGYQHPPLESVVAALHACGLELTVGMARYDDSYDSLIARQLMMEPVDRVTRLARRAAGLTRSRCCASWSGTRSSL